MSSENLLENNDILENNECIICFDPIDNEKIKINIFKDCDHTNNYHIKCANNWIKECTEKNIKPTCPVCRNEMIIIDIQYNEQTINYKPLKYFIFITSVLLITVYINHNY